jgi:hypothetical protein
MECHPWCRQCGDNRTKSRDGVCRTCKTGSDREPTEEELAATIAAQQAKLPKWWGRDHDGSTAETVERPVRVVRLIISRRRWREGEA